MITEMEAVHLFRALERDGYKLEQDGERWNVTEPPRRYMPQRVVGLHTLREAMAWAEGVHAVRFVLTLNLTE